MQNAAVSTKKKKGELVFSPQEDGGKVKCKILAKVSPAGNGAFAWYDLSDTDATSHPQSFSTAVATAKWKVLNTNAGYFMGNEKSAEIFVEGAPPIKVLLATLAKLIGDMSTALASSEWMALFHPGGRNEISEKWIDAWTGSDVDDLVLPVNILDESGDRLQEWQGSDRNGATLYTGSRQDDNNMQTARFRPSPLGIAPDALLRITKANLQHLRSSIFDQYSELVANLNGYIERPGPDGEFAGFYEGVPPAKHPIVSGNLTTYLTHVRGRILNFFDTVVDPELLRQIDRVMATNDVKQIKAYSDILRLQIVDKVPQKTSFFTKPGKLHKAFQIANGQAVLPSPYDAMTTILTRARYGMRGGAATVDDALDAFAIALRIPMLARRSDPMFLQLAAMYPPVADPPVADPAVEPPGVITFEFNKVPTPAADKIENTVQLLTAIRQGIPLHEKWKIMKTAWGVVADADADAMDQDAEHSDNQLWDEIADSVQIHADAKDNMETDTENLGLIMASEVVEPNESTTNDRLEKKLLNGHFVRYGRRMGGFRLPDAFSGDIQPTVASPRSISANSLAKYDALRRTFGQVKPIQAFPPRRTIRNTPPTSTGAVTARKSRIPPAYRPPGGLTLRTPIPPPIQAFGGRTYRRRRLPKLL